MRRQVLITPLTIAHLFSILMDLSSNIVRQRQEDINTRGINRQHRALAKVGVVQTEREIFEQGWVLEVVGVRLKGSDYIAGTRKVKVRITNYACH